MGPMGLLVTKEVRFPILFVKDFSRQLDTMSCGGVCTSNRWTMHCISDLSGYGFVSALDLLDFLVASRGTYPYESKLLFGQTLG